MDLLQVNNNNYQATEKLLDILERRDDSKVKMFFECLITSEQKHIVQLILGDTVQQSENILEGNRNRLRIRYISSVCPTKAAPV